MTPAAARPLAASRKHLDGNAAIAVLQHSSLIRFQGRRRPTKLRRLRLLNPLRLMDISYSSLWIFWGERIKRKLIIGPARDAVANGLSPRLSTLGGQPHDSTEISMFI
ncbi:MAG: hypothetical protein JO094_10030 [Hyphomicrobiales bacterium]|nr:hypothetical protein [Hyphomicrobiales bacterium]MBV8769220.1 hypothetical protein [Hyphomicrobiales bacterium]